MKRVKITLPKGGYRYGPGRVPLDVKEGSTYEIEADEIIIEGDVTLAQAPAARIPFDLEAAKAGAQVLWGDDPVRWVGRGNEKSSIQAFNIIEHSEGLAYAPDKDLFMAPKAKKFLWLNIYPQGTNSGRDVGVHSSEEKAKLAATSNCIGIAQRVEVDA